MDAKGYLLLINIIVGLVILAGLAVTIIGIVKKKQLLIAIGVLIALLPTIIKYFI
ncbi:MAG: hypothetical protein ABIP35_08555 [Ginsengibacter sp.]